MKKIIITFHDDKEAEKMKNIFVAAGYNAVIADPDTFIADGLIIDFPARVIIANGRKIHLTPLEFRIVEFLAKNHNIVFTHEQIINEIWGPHNSDNQTLRVNIANIRKKIEENPAAPRYIKTEAGVGYFMDKQVAVCPN